MRIAIYGAGAIGGHLAARLARGGANVAVIARGPQLAAIRATGIRIEAPDGTWTARPTAATDTPADLGVQDIVITAVKAPALPAIAAAIAPLLGPSTQVAFVTNGIPWWYFHQHGGPWDDRRLPRIDPGDAIRHAIGPHRAIGGVVYSACTVTAPGTIQVTTKRDKLILGTPSGAPSPAIAAIAAPLQQAGMTVEQTPQIRHAIWQKLLMNLALGPVCVLAAAAPRDLLTSPAIEAAMRASYAEATAIAAAMGCPVTTDIDAQIAYARAMTHKPSILQDLELSRPMEIDGIYDAALSLARLSATPTPTLDRLIALVKVRARAAGLY